VGSGEDVPVSVGDSTRRIYLIGFMAAGKSKVGRFVAESLKFPFVDLDHAICYRAGLEVVEIFARHGESVFRDLEFQCLEETEAYPKVVVATGGGTVAYSRNWEIIHRAGMGFWLDPSFETILGRLGVAGRAKRPRFHDEAQARLLYQERQVEYAQADFRIEISASETAQDVAARIYDLARGESCDT
jgi:shikimate kinase